MNFDRLVKNMRLSKPTGEDGVTSVTIRVPSMQQTLAEIGRKIESEETVLTSADLKMLQEVEGGSALDFAGDDDDTSTALPPSSIYYEDRKDETSSYRLLKPADLSDDQKDAYDAIMAWVKAPGSQRVMSLGGYAGTGKTSLLGVVADQLCNVMGKSVAFLTPTAKAASVLRRKIQPLGISPEPFCGTVHSFQYSPITDGYDELTGWARRYFTRIEEPDGSYSYQAKGKGERPKLHLLIVDEASMVNHEMESDICAFGIPVLAVGDHGQLPPVQGKSTWMTNPTIRLEKIHRQAEDSPVLALATYIREEGALPPRLRDFVPYYRSLHDVTQSLLDAYTEHGEHDVAMLCFTNKLRARINMAVHEHQFGTRKPTRGSQVICLKNTIDLTNGMRGHIIDDPSTQDIWTIGSVRFPDESFVYRGPFLTAQFGTSHPPKNTLDAAALVGRFVDKLESLGALMDFGYCMTVHKAQGSQFKEVFIALESGRMSNDFARWAYTAVTRAQEKVSFVEVLG